tara:strand:- start:116 stop:643 length:528 start_codon:yes stop_codon:yes gene_type:complete
MIIANINKKLLLVLCFDFLFSSIHLNHGISTSITNSGQRLLYSNEININKIIKLHSNFGLHNETSLSINYYNQIESNSKNANNYIPLNIGCHYKLFENSMVGYIKPYLFGEFGNVFSIKQFNLDGVHLEDSGEEISLGIGLQFYKIKSNQYIFLGYTSNKIIEGNMILGFKLVWK